MSDDIINRKKAINAIERSRKERTMSDDLIKRSDAIKAVNREKSDWNCDYNVPIDNCIKRLNKVKSADRPQGEWIVHKINGIPHTAECSCCHNHYDYEDLRRIGGVKEIIVLPYCPNCGARMKERASDECDC